MHAAWCFLITSTALPRVLYMGGHDRHIYHPPHTKMYYILIATSTSKCFLTDLRRVFEAEICHKRMTGKRFSSCLCSFISLLWQNRKSLVCEEDKEGSEQESNEVL